LTAVKRSARMHAISSSDIKAGGVVRHHGPFVPVGCAKQVADGFEESHPGFPAEEPLEAIR
jgi:hypothetical protein